MSQHNEWLDGFLRKRHSVSKLVVHLIFTTKYRRTLFDGCMIEQLREAFTSAATKLECDIIEMDGEQDHVHLLIAYPTHSPISLSSCQPSPPSTSSGSRPAKVSLPAILLATPFTIEFMAKEQTDRTTLDLFADERRPGRPKTNPLSRDEQLRINKRNQLRRDKVKGLRRVELKLNEDAVDALNHLAKERNISRSELIEQMLSAQLAENHLTN
ncbi:putative LexA regulated, SOS response (modular protein) [Xenorhabdus bovienii str. feltiae Moldova]|uniref:Putative LexA regulated, SOS response (Modular protein) n=1 Tax=Xenorhabdus bovienii str. feltiae Moldova TaxID=1398200 RepID=A0A077NY12_XENBV|nr:putative LexA regulated, SOS response (modular protein) [Xenorhabdus bovienii str. feltiae Moldova]